MTKNYFVTPYFGQNDLAWKRLFETTHDDTVPIKISFLFFPFFS